MEDMRNTYKILVGKHEGKRLFRRPRCTSEYIIRLDVTEISWEVVDWIHVAQDRVQWRAVVYTVMNPQ
jgi:hypothetical protein